MNLRKAKLSLLFVLIVSLALIVSAFQPKYAILIVYANPEPDSYGNCINQINIYQWNGTAYKLLTTETASNFELRVEDSKAIKIEVTVQLNSTLASSEQEAIDYTECTITIGTIVTEASMINTNCILQGDFYILTYEYEWNQAGYPQAGETYNVGIEYKAYY